MLSGAGGIEQNVHRLVVAACKGWPSAKTIPRGMEIAEKFGLGILPPSGK